MVQLLDRDIKTREVLAWKGVHLVHALGSSCSQKTRICLNLKGVPWESHEVDFDSRANYAWFLGINPRGLVPILVHDGVVHIESNDIITYVDQNFPGLRLIPEGREAEIAAMLKQEDDLHLDLRALSMRFVFGEERARRSEETLEIYETEGSGTVLGRPDPRKPIEVDFWRRMNDSGVTDEWARAAASNFRAAFGAALWLGVTGGLAIAGVLSFETMPPTMLIVMALLTAGTVMFALSGVGSALASELPLAALVGFQSFRILVELWLHRGYELGHFPVQMTYSGLNFDVVTGVSALLVAWLVHRGVAGRRVVLAWNVVGLGLLATIVTIAILSAPLPFRLFTAGPANVYVTGFPGVWLPAVMVQAALLGHVLVFRRLLGQGAASE